MPGRLILILFRKNEFLCCKPWGIAIRGSTKRMKNSKNTFAKLRVNFAKLCVTASYKFRKVTLSSRKGTQRTFNTPSYR